MSEYNALYKQFIARLEIDAKHRSTMRRALHNFEHDPSDENVEAFRVAHAALVESEAITKVIDDARWVAIENDREWLKNHISQVPAR